MVPKFLEVGQDKMRQIEREERKRGHNGETVPKTVVRMKKKN